MRARKFELWMGLLGNGITVCNKAVEEHGDYKMVAHISAEGSVHWYVKDDYAPPEAKAKIEEEAARLRVKHQERLDRLSPAARYERELDAMSTAELVEHLKRKRGEKS